MAAKDRSLVDTLWEFACSLRLTLFTLILLAVTSIIGTVIPQGRTAAEYRQIYTEKVYQLFDRLDFFDMYDSWWFILLLALLALNLIACSINRFPRVWKLVRQPTLIPGEGLLQSLGQREELVTDLSPATTTEVVTRLLRQRMAAPTVSEADGKTYLFAQRGGFSRFGAYIVHLSIVVILVGAIMGMVWGVKGWVNIPEGQTIDRIVLRDSGQYLPLGFAVTCEDFSVTFYPNGRTPKEFRSVLTVSENGQPVPGLEHKSIVVNDPLTYKGFTFYQASYSATGDPQVVMRVRERSTGTEEVATVELGAMTNLPGGKGRFRLLPPPPSMQSFGLGVTVQVWSEGKTPPRTFMVFQNNPEFDEKRGGAYVFKLEGLEQAMSTGLQVAKDPGVPLVWLGCALMILGCFVAFFVAHRRFWVVIRPLENGKTGVLLAGTTHRNQPAFEQAFENLVREAQGRLSGQGAEV